MNIDHQAYPRALRQKSNDSLWFIIRDCQAAIRANPDNPKCGYYADEISYCANELARRSNRGRK